MTENEETRRVPLIWEEQEDVAPIAFANQFIVQHQPHEFVLMVGQVVAPPLLGTDEDKRKQLEHISYVPIRTIGRFALTRRRMVELITVLQANLENHDRLVKSLGDAEQE
jgi:hypothetical protein